MNLSYSRWVGVIIVLVIITAGCNTGWFTNEKRDQAVSSKNIITNQAGTVTYIANLDVPTVTLVDTTKNKVLREIPVGKNPSTLTLSSDQKELYVACTGDNRIDVIDLDQQQVVQQIKTGIEPYAVLTSPDGEWLYVSNFRSHTLSIIDRDEGKVTKQIQLDEKPRAMAMTRDGKKLYVLHYLNGKISIVDLTHQQVKKQIKLANSPDQSDRKKSQGIPNTLEQIEITPDGKTAWVTHLLTNVDTPIHFDETIFPAISKIDIQKDVELLAERKELFKGIDIKDTQNKTMIVSNPSDIQFNTEKTKAYVLMTGSEDLVVFDLTLGGNATEIIRRIPGDFPIGMSLSKDGKVLNVHNGMSHDLVQIETGKGEEYGETQVKEEKPLRLIKKDSLSPLVREGKKLFYSANSDENAADLTQDNWMSCASCHAGGETDGLTLMTTKGPRNVPSNVLAMKTGRFLWDGSRDDFEDYLLTVQTEMGGMLRFDPSKPLPKDVKKIYQALAAYLATIPVPQNPTHDQRGKLTAEQKQGKALFEGKANCISCHAGTQMTDSAKAVDQQGQLTALTSEYLYNVGTTNPLDQPSSGDPRAGMKNPRDTIHFDVPTLRGIFTTAPYLHDGSAKTIQDVLTKKNPLGLHGKVGDLNKQELHALVKYVESLQ
ncbi:40-residue YVTN family beta-propeller repeat-containing protein [Seinonella peptonophila]|uniref:40-residue YVTN family beta-propeller repeat-containing protein n=1 Tax=Seinonella peptonophila TaxID=112248 RepID=A0A1M4ZED7_9BACL|nr:beta-propeller fold lactonase family protein [Seinonella peptonophila]SHF16404.1 40-residue YVTN family beta-propeller repeat-containing protein [Seinonella peptonophila]